jgi:short-subunit dehydrogenase
MHVAITGASSGIGAALAREFAKAGAKVTLVARRKALLDALAEEIGETARVVAHDLGDPNRATDWIDDAERDFGPIDVLINNAGVQIVAPTSSIDPKDAEDLLRLDLLTPLRLTRAMLPRMLARKSGTIVDIASVAAIAPTPGMFYYNAAKAGLAAASESLRGELRGTGVHVVTVYPGVIAATEMAQKALAVIGESRALAFLPQGTPEKLALRVRRAVERKRARVIYPRSMALGRHLPNATRWLLDSFTPSLRAVEPARA